jgi:hypothetical protein
VPALKKDEGWRIIEVPQLQVRLSCGHLVLVPERWVQPDGRVGRLQCNQGLCRKITEDVVLCGWEGAVIEG